MRKILAVLTAIALLLSLAAPACAEEATSQADSATLASTRRFMEYLDERKWFYDYNGVNDNGNEIVCVTISGNNVTLDEYLYFYPNETTVAIRAWNVIDYAEDDFIPVIKVCNDMNYSYRWVRAFADESDHSVTAAADVAFTENDVGELTFSAMIHMINIIDACWDKLSPYHKQ